jgi:hypothetical protein
MATKKNIPKKTTVALAAVGDLAAKPVAVAKKAATPKVPVKVEVVKKAAPAKKVVAKKVPPVKEAQSKVVPIKKPAGPKTKVFQIYFQSGQKLALDPAFETYNNEGDKSPLLEYNVFKKLAGSQLTQGLDLWGAVSWKFGEKTKMQGHELLKVIADNPGYDVYFCNPSPEIEGLYHNIWLQGETSHPNFLALSEAFFKAAGWPQTELVALRPSSHFSSANYFVGNDKFWAKFIQFIDAALLNADKKLSKQVKDLLYSPAADYKLLHKKASYLPFIIERAFGVFMATGGAGLRSFKYGLTKKTATFTVHQKLLTEMKDMAFKTKSEWLATCWVNYRNLYLAQVANKEWVKLNLKKISPTKVSF